MVHNGSAWHSKPRGSNTGYLKKSSRWLFEYGNFFICALKSSLTVIWTNHHNTRPSDRAVTTDCSHYWLISHIFSWLMIMTQWLIIAQNVKKMEKMLSKFPRAQFDVFRLLFLPKQQPKHRYSSFIIINNTKKQQILTFKRINQQFFLLSYSKDETINWASK